MPAGQRFGWDSASEPNSEDGHRNQHGDCKDNRKQDILEAELLHSGNPLPERALGSAMVVASALKLENVHDDFSGRSIKLG